MSKLLNNSLTRSTLWMLLGYAGRLVFQTASFILLARLLGLENFGAFTAALAVVVLFAPLVELGGYPLVVKQVAQDATATHRYLGNALSILLFTTPIALIILTGLQYFLLPKISLVTLLLVAVSDFVGERTRMVVCAAFIAHQQHYKNAWLEVTAGALRLCLVGLLWLWGASLEHWALLYFLGGLTIGLIAYFWGVKSFGKFSSNLKEAFSNIPEGFFFSVGLAAQSAYADMDKAMLARLSTLEATGIYGVAYRLINLAYLPLNAFLSSVYPRLVKTGQDSFREAFVLSKRMFPVTALYGFFASLGLFVLAPLLPYVFGNEYIETVNALRWLAFVPFIQALYWIFADALTATGHQRLRSYAQLTTLALNILLNLFLIPTYSWKGAAIATFLSELTMLGIIALTVRRKNLAK
jgi:O-antigen/teichoic acid export membrane protein